MSAVTRGNVTATSFTDTRGNVYPIIKFVSPSGAKPGSIRYFEEAMAAEFYGVDDAETFAFKKA